MKFQYSVKIFGKYMSKFMKIHSVGAEVFHADKRRGGYDEANIRYS